MTDPVYGGVSASLALLGDINAAEPGVRVGFAGLILLNKRFGKNYLKDFSVVNFY